MKLITGKGSKTMAVLRGLALGLVAVAFIFVIYFLVLMLLNTVLAAGP
jgi:hypothetical protein